MSAGHNQGPEPARSGSDRAAEEHASESASSGSGARPGEEAVEAELTETAAPEGGVILTDMVALATERDEYRDALQRLQADFENYRKRVQRQQEEQAARAELALVGKLLDVLDTLDLAQAHLGAAEGDSTEGKALSQHPGLMALGARHLGNTRAAPATSGASSPRAEALTDEPHAHEGRGALSIAVLSGA